MLGNLHCSNFYFLLFLILLLGAKAPNQTWFDTMLGEKEIVSYFSRKEYEAYVWTFAKKVKRKKRKDETTSYRITTLTLLTLPLKLRHILLRPNL